MVKAFETVEREVLRISIRIIHLSFDFVRYYLLSVPASTSLIHIVYLLLRKKEWLELEVGRGGVARENLLID